MPTIPKPEVDVGLLQSGPGLVSAPGPTYSDPNFGVPNDQGQPEVDINILPGVPGQRGPAGPTGPQGPKGADGITQTIAYVHTQNAVSSTWSITHNLGFNPNVTTVDSAETGIEGTVTHNSANALTVTFGIATSGKAYLSQESKWLVNF